MADISRLHRTLVLTTHFRKPTMRAGHTAWKSLFFAALLACGDAAFAADGDPANFVVWRSGLASSAQPNTAFLKRVKSLGYDIVINLAPPEYDGAVANEGALLAAQGVIYLNIPVRFGDPTVEDFQLFSDVMKSVVGKNVLVHCQINLRGSAFVYLYRVIAESASEQELRSKLNSVWVPNPVWKKFIERTLAAGGKKVELL